MSPLIRNWAIVHSYDGKGKPEACLEPVNAVLKGKSHVFESRILSLLLLNVIRICSSNNKYIPSVIKTDKPMYLFKVLYNAQGN